MKTITYIINILVCLITIQTTFAQSDRKVHPDVIHFWDKEHEWDEIHQKYYAFTNLNSELVTFYQDNYSVGNNDTRLKLYSYSHEDKEFKYQKTLFEKDHAQVTTKPVPFDFAGRSYVISYYKNTNGDEEDIHRMKLFYTKTASLTDWHHHTSQTAFDKNIHLYRAAWYSGDSIYLVYNSYHKINSNNEEEFVKYNKDVRVDVAVMDSHNRLKVERTILFDDVLEKDVYNPYAISGFTNENGHLRLLISYSAEHTSDKENKGGGVFVGNPATGHTHKLYYKDHSIFSIRAIHGSIKGKHTVPSGSTQSEKDNPSRIQVFYNYLDTDGWDKGHYYYHTFTVSDYKEIASGIIAHPDDDMLPDDWEDLSLEVTKRYYGKYFDDSEKANDEVHQSIWLFRVNKHQHIYADIFRSDIMKADYHHTLVKCDTLISYTNYNQDAKSLWTLVGITEGAPPSSINWPVWEDTYPAHYDATEMSHDTESSESTGFTSKYERSFYNETGVQIGGGELDAGGAHASYKYTGTFSREYSNDTITTSLDILSFGLTKNNQNLAWLIWVVPDIHRVTYNIYPWWDENYQYKQEGSKCFQYYCNHLQQKLESVPMSDMPFNVLDPNNPSMDDWKSGFSAVRDTIVYEASDIIMPVATTWTNNQHGTTQKLTEESFHTKSVTNFHSFDITIGANADIPEVFEISTEDNFEWSYSTTSTHSTHFSNSYEVSLHNMNEADNGINLQNLNIQSYLFEPNIKIGNEIKEWWYYKYFPGYKPWYITHVVTGSEPLKIIIPVEDGFVEKNTSIIWEHKVDMQFEYTVFFSKSSRFYPNETQKIGVGKSKKLIDLNVLEQFNEGEKIYWVVQGKSNDKEIIYSPIRWFIKNSQLDREFIMYPNPTVNNNVNLLFSGFLPGEEFFVSLESLQGDVIVNKRVSVDNLTNDTYNFLLNHVRKGVYLVRVSNQYFCQSKKIIIL